MKDKIISALSALKRPGWKILLPTYIITLLACVGSLLTLLIESGNPLLDAISYALYALAAISLGYSVYTVVIFAPGMKRGVINAIESRKFTRELLENHGFRALVQSAVSVTMGIAYGLFNGVLGIMSRSVWYGSLSAYYIFLTLMRTGILVYHKKKSATPLDRARTYRNSGILLVILNVALSFAIAEMIFSDRAFEYAGLMIYVAATYAFYKITMAIINICRKRGGADLAMQAMLNINLTDAAVSILALQTALLHTFSEGEVNISLFNTLTGSAVSLTSLSLGIFMVIKSIKTIKEIKNGK